MSLSKFESMLKTNSVYFFDATEFENIIDFYIESGKHSLAKKALSLGLEQHPKSTLLLILKAELMIFEDELSAAYKLLNHLQAIEPTNSEIYVQLADIYSKKHKHNQAVGLLDQALVFTDNPADIWLLLGMEYIYLNNFKEARLYFEYSLKDSPDDFAALFNVVYCFDMEKQADLAIKFLTEFTDENPYSEIGWHQLGRQYYNIKNFEEALRAFDFASLIDEDFVGAYVEKAKTLERLGDFEKAIENYLISLELDDPTAFVLYRVGKCYEKIGNGEQSTRFFAKAIVEDPLLEKGWFSLSKTYYEKRDFEKALYYCKALLNIEDSNSTYWNLFSVLCLKLSLFEEAIEGFKECLALEKDDLEIWVAIIDCLVFIGDFNTAKNYAELGMTNHMNTAELTYRLGGLEYLYGNKEIGTLLLKKAEGIDLEYKVVMKEVFPELFIEDKKLEKTN